MCFTPWISLSTAIVEFVLAGILIFGFKKYRLRYFWGALILLLGLYQLVEFFLCSTQQALFWAKLGFITYTFLPALGVHTALRFLNKKANLYLLYFLPAAYTLYAMLTRGFVLTATCEKVFVKAQTIITQPQGLFQNFASAIYVLYYVGFVTIFIFLLWAAYRHERSRRKKRVELLDIGAGILMIVPTFVLIVIFPFLGLMFPSVLCQFAIFVAVLVFIGCYMDNKR